MPAVRNSRLFFLMALAATPALAQDSPPNPDAIRSSLEEIFSLATFGALSVRNQAAEVTQNGADYQVRLPLSGFSAPADPVILATARPAEHGMLDITSMTFPSAGTIETKPASGGPATIAYAIGQQTITAKIDPTLAMPSSYAATFGQVRVSSDHGDQHAEQLFDHYTVDGTVSADPGGLVTLTSQGSGTGFHLVSRGLNGFISDASVKALAGHFAVEGLDRGRATRLLGAAHGLSAGARQPGQPPGLSGAQREALRDVIEALTGLMSRIEVEESLEDVHFDIGAGPGTTSGAIGRVRVTMTGDTADQRLNTHIGVLADEISTPMMTAAHAGFMPHHIDLRTILAGVPVRPLMALMRAATAPGADPAVLQAQAMSLFADPRVRAGIESLSFDSGPLRITGSARVVPRPGGDVGADIHIAASGVDALLAEAQSQPSLQGIMPMVFMAKGMGRPQGDGLVWDISLGDGPIKINGVPFGQAQGKTR